MMTIQLKYQREIDRLEKELQSMKKQLLLNKDRHGNNKKQRKIKVRLSCSLAFETIDNTTNVSLGEIID
jgi:hypothetical protein